MNRWIIIAALTLGLAVAFPCRAQEKTAEALLQKLEAHQTPDTTRCRILLDLGEVYKGRNPGHAIKHCDEALSIARNLKVPKMEITALNLQGQSHANLHEIEQARQVLLEAIALARQVGDSFELARNYHHLGSVFLNSGNAESAIDYYKASETISGLTGRYDSQASTRDNLGAAYTLLGDYNLALDYHFKALTVLENQGNESRLANCYMNIGNVFNYLNQVEKARLYYEKSLRCCTNLNDRRGMTHVNINIGITYLNDPDIPNCFKYLLDAYEILVEDSQLFGISVAQMNMAHRLNNLCDADYELLKADNVFRGIDSGTSNQYEFALKLLNSNLEIYQRLRNWFSYNFTLHLIGESYYKLQQYEKALPFLHRALLMADTLEYLDKQRLALNKLSQVHEAMQQYDSALYYYQKHIVIRDSLSNSQKLKEVQRRELEYEFETREKELRHQKELSDLNADLAREMAQQHLLRLRTSEQALSLQSKELEISEKEKELGRLEVLKQKADLQALDLEKTGKAKELALLQKEHELSRQTVKNRSLQRNISFGVILAAIVIIGVVVRNFRRQRRYNRQLKVLQVELENVNALLKKSNAELSTTLEELKSTQERLIETEKQKEKEAIRRRIAQDMHDEISSGLTKIVWLCEMAGKKVARADYIAVEGVIGRISESSRRTVERISEIIWAIDPDRDNLEGFYAYLRSYIMEYFEPTGYKVRLTFPEKDGMTHFEPDVKRALFAVIKEALHNVVKHAKGSEVDVDFSVEEANYKVVIDDNGRGIGLDGGNNHRSGLRNMKERMEAVGGSFGIGEKDTAGTKIMLQGPVSGR